MKHLILAISVVLTAAALFGQQKSPQPKTDMDKVSYSIGLQIGLNLQKQEEALKKQNVQINTDALVNGLKDALAGKPQLTPDQVRATLTAFEQDMTRQQQAAESLYHTVYEHVKPREHAVYPAIHHSPLRL